MRKILAYSLLLVLLACLAGCAPMASEQFGKLDSGMTPSQVKSKLGEPEVIRRVRFSDQQVDYLVYEYSYRADIPNCPSAAVGRSISGLATLGISELVYQQASREPHWVYFLDNHLVHTGLAVDCQEYGCKTWLDVTDKNFISE